MKLYQERGLQTWEQILKKWVGYNPQKYPQQRTYVQDIGAWSGVDMSAKANLNDVNEVSRVLAAQAQRENAMNISPAQVAAMLRGGPRGAASKQQASIVKMRQDTEAGQVGTRLGNDVLNGKITAADARAQIEKLQPNQQQAAYRELNQAVAQLRDEERAAKEAAQEQAFGIAERYDALVQAKPEDGGGEKAANDYLLAEYEKVEYPKNREEEALKRKLRPLVVQTGLLSKNGKGMTAEEKAVRDAEGVVLYRRLYDDFRSKNGGQDPDKDAKAKMREKAGILSKSAVDKCEEYKGWETTYSQMHIDKRIKATMGREPTEKESSSVYNFLRSRLQKDGKVLTDKEIDSVVANMLDPRGGGRGEVPGVFFGSNTISGTKAYDLFRSTDPVDQQRGAAYRPEVPEDDKRRLREAALATQPWLAGSGNRALLDAVTAIDYGHEHGLDWITLTAEEEKKYRALMEKYDKEQEDGGAQ